MNDLGPIEFCTNDTNVFCSRTVTVFRVMLSDTCYSNTCVYISYDEHAVVIFGLHRTAFFLLSVEMW